MLFYSQEAGELALCRIFLVTVRGWTSTDEWLNVNSKLPPENSVNFYLLHAVYM